MAMESNAADEVLLGQDALRIYRSGKMDRLHRPVLVPAGVDAATGVTSKDVVVDADSGLSVRIFLPTDRPDPSKKIPVVVFFHGGAFVIESAVSTTYHTFAASLAAAAGAVVVSVEYRLAPEHPVPAAYDDAWAALQWAVSGKDEWLAENGDFGRLFLAGDSAGGNMVHHVLLKSASSDPAPPKIEGAILLHPWFGGNTLVDGEPEEVARDMAKIWVFACPGAVGGADDPRFNPTAPGAAAALENIRCERMLVCTGEKDWAGARGRAYYAAVTASAWRGSAAWLESEGEGHVFFLEKPECEKTKEVMDRVVAFISGSRGIWKARTTAEHQQQQKAAMDPAPATTELRFDSPLLRIYNDGRVERLFGTDTTPAGFDAATGVTSKDVVIDADTGLSARLYLPAASDPGHPKKKLPIVV
uniref:Alpha/beta hydrolase fold-3 domain-containing protein n=1 Tax=Leersia perrieri TaxID=77586 RepID=A0A0D9XEJ5_9ORYZ